LLNKSLIKGGLSVQGYNKTENALDLLNLTDEELVLLYNNGNLDAQEAILRRYKNFVRAKARTYFLVGADNDDIVQEGMIGLYKAVRDFNVDKQSSFRTFADLCVTRQIITAIKSATRNKHFPLNSYISLNKPIYENDTERTLMDVISEEIVSDPEELILVNESFEEMEQKISNELSTFEKNVLSLYLEGCSYQEISLALNKHLKSIDNALQRIKKKLTKFRANKAN